MEPLPETPRKEPKRLSPEAVVLCAFAGVVMPVACFMTAVQWQPFRPSSPQPYGGIGAYLLEPFLFVAFVPLMVYALVSMALVLIDLPRFGRHFAVRFGLATGIALTVQYFMVLAASLADSPMGEGVLMQAGALSAASVLLLFGLWVLARDRLGWRVALLLVIAAAAIGVVVFGPGFDPPSVFDLRLLALGGAPAWSLATYVSVAAWTVLMAPAEPTRGRTKALLIGGWLAACAAAWIYSAVMIGALKAGTITLSR